MTAELTHLPETPSLPPSNLIYDDGVPLESNRHRIAMNVLIASTHAALMPRQDYFTGGNMFVYYSTRQARNQGFRGPDFFVTLNVDGSKERKYWAIWEEDGRYPDVIVELMSPSTATIDRQDKKHLYADTFRTREYFIYDPFDPDSLQGWRLGEQGYRELTKNERGWLWCETLGLWLGLWQGEIFRETTPWLRFYDGQGHLVLLPEEQEWQRAEQAEQALNQERQRAEQAEQALNQERQTRLAAVSRLLSLGLTVNQVAAALDLTVADVEQVQA